ncbi:MAG: aminopeptidase P family protein [Lachnospiraceae bacterium]|nr:aminopeptidase P family protein [Lachnospiraceae bacterium]
MESIKRNRIERVIKLMNANGLDAVLVSNCALGNLNTWLLAKEDMPLHIPFNRNNLCLVTTKGEVLELCAREPHPCDWYKYPLITETDLTEYLPNKRLGLVNPTYLKKVVRDDLMEKYGTELIDVSDEFHLLKMEKTGDEIEGIRKAAALFDRAFTSIPMLLTGEHTEREIAAGLRNRFREMDAECEDLQSSTMLSMTSAPDGAPSEAEPILWPGRRVVYGDRINIKINGYMPGGFASAIARTFVIGDPCEETRKYWDLAVSAQKLIAENAKPGVTVKELMDLFREKILTPEGLEESSENQIYGIGTGISEAPRSIDSTRDIPLADGMTLVIAPVIRPEGKDPYCAGDVFVVTKDGAKRLNRTSSELYVLQ